VQKYAICVIREVQNMFPNIKAEIARHNLTMGELANSLNVTRKTIGKWLRDGCIPACALIKMAELFDVSIDYLLGRSDR
jgi:transcriptional regulator with XRE-family HTH domain